MTPPADQLSPGTEVIRVVLADDHPVVRAGLAALLASLPGIEVVGVAKTGREAVREVITTRPDVAVLDLQMPDLDGFAATRELVRSAPEVAVLVLTMFEDDDSVFAAMRAGARGYLLKGADAAQLVTTIRTLASGGTAFGPSVARRIVGFFLESSQKYAQGAFPELTARERDVLDLLAAGKRNSVIAGELSLSEKTVRNHLSSILTKLQVADRSAAIVRAREAGLGRS